MLNPPLGYVSCSDLLTAIRQNLHKVPADVELVVGIPRSGMIPAYGLGLFLNLPVIDLNSFLLNSPAGYGHTRKIKNMAAASMPQAASKILLVDDSYCSGKSMRLAEESILKSGYHGSIVKCVPIIVPTARSKVDISFITMNMPRVFEWNVFHHSVISEACVDIDGVLCVDPNESENDDGDAYLRFLRNASPLFRPTVEIAHIVSSRLEKYRAETIAWLNQYGIKYRELHLLDLPNQEERIRQNAHHRIKVDVYKSTDTGLFIESSPEQAKLIARLSGKPVLCVETMEMLSGAEFCLNAPDDRASKNR